MDYSNPDGSSPADRRLGLQGRPLRHQPRCLGRKDHLAEHTRQQPTHTVCRHTQERLLLADRGKDHVGDLCRPAQQRPDLHRVGPGRRQVRLRLLQTTADQRQPRQHLQGRERTHTQQHDTLCPHPQWARLRQARPLQREGSMAQLRQGHLQGTENLHAQHPGQQRSAAHHGRHSCLPAQHL